MNPRFDDLVVTKWRARFQGQSFPCAIGRGGIGIKQGEGDGITPVGVFNLAGLCIRPDRLNIANENLSIQLIGLHDVWSDDPEDPDYNQGLRSFGHPFSHEKLRRSDPLYDMFGVLDFNWPEPVPGGGSAIFLHIWRKPRFPTEGCIAFSKANFIHIARNWQPHSRVIVQA